MKHAQPSFLFFAIPGANNKYSPNDFQSSCSREYNPFNIGFSVFKKYGFSTSKSVFLKVKDI